VLLPIVKQRIYNVAIQTLEGTLLNSPKCRLYKSSQEVIVSHAVLFAKMFIPQG